MPTASATKKAQSKAHYQAHKAEYVERALARRKKDPAEHLAHVMAWRTANPARWRAITHKWHIKRYYGLTLEQFDEMLVAQSGRCALCSEPLTDSCVDHDHKTNKVRALLHKRCNVRLEAVEDERFCSSALAYLEQYRG